MATGGAGAESSPRNIPPPSHAGAPAPLTASQPTSPPSKRELASWWKKFRKTTEKTDEKVDIAPGIFGVPLAESIRYANVAISLTNDDGESFIYGYVPIVVAKCGVFLKEKATDVEGIFRLAGSAKRIKDLQAAFNSPDRYGKGLDWTGYTVHDAANILRRYLNQLPEPIVPLDFYERFREPLRPYQTHELENGQRGEIDMSVDQHGDAVLRYQKLITELPPLNRQLLLYILDLLAVFASKSDLNRMTAANLAAIFQPGIISHPQHDMAPKEYRLSQDVLIFLIENQDHFLIGMSGTAVDEKTVKDVESGAPSVRSPKASNIGRSASNASAGADSLRKQGVRRNVSVHSHGSRERSSPGVSSPGTPTGHGSFGSASGAVGVTRSNTVPSKRSPAIGSTRYRGMQDSPTASPIVEPPTPEVSTPVANVDGSARTATVADIQQSASTALAATDVRQAPSQAEPQPGSSPVAAQQVAGRERKISNLFSKSPIFGPTDASGRPTKKLQKRRLPGAANESAHSSQASFQADEHPSGFHTPLLSPELGATNRADPMNSSPAHAASDQRPVSSTEKHAETFTPPKQGNLRPPGSPAGSLHSGTSVTDHSEFDTLDAPGPTSQPKSGEEKEKRRHRWRFSSSAKKGDDYPLQPPPRIGENSGARGSNSSVGSGYGGPGQARPRKSFTGESQATSTSHPEVASTTGSQGALLGQSSNEGEDRYRETSREQSNSISGAGDEKKGIFGKWKAKMSERREEKERAKSPPPRVQPGVASEEAKSRSSLSAFAQEHFNPRGRSFDKQRSNASEFSQGSGHGQSGVVVSSGGVVGPGQVNATEKGEPVSANVVPAPVSALGTVKEGPVTEAGEANVTSDATQQTHDDEVVAEEKSGKLLEQDSNAAKMAGDTLTAEMERSNGEEKRAGRVETGATE